jgi:diguanylate cyclase (GGDEF)-like protein/PAS domain S-box-containing protein
MEQGAPPPTDLRSVARVCGATAIVIGAATVAGWLAGAPVLTRISPALPTTTPLTGLMLAASGVVVILEAGRRAGTGVRLVASCLSALVVLAAAAVLIEHIADTSLGIDLRIGSGYGDAAHPGRPAPHSAAAFALLGACLLMARWRTRSGDVVAGVVGAGAATAVGLAVAGQVVRVKYLGGSDEVHGMSVTTAAGFVALLAGVFALRPAAPPGSWFAGAGAGDAAARRMMLPALVLPFVGGALAQGGASLGLYSERFALAVMIVIFAALFQGLIYIAVRTVRAHEAAEHESLTRFAMLASRVPVGVFETDLEGRVVFVNDRWTQLTGLDQEAVARGQSALHPEDREEIRDRWDTARATGQDFQGEFRIVRPDGTTRWVTSAASPLRDESGDVTGFIGSMLDVTERRAAEERTALVVDRIAEAINVIGAEGSIVHSNDAARAILADLRQRHDAGPVGELGWGTIDANGNAVANEDLPAEVTRNSGREVTERVLGFPDRDGDVRWLRISTRKLTSEGPPFSVLVSFVDMTEQRAAAAQLEEAESRFALAFEHAPIGFNLVSLEGRLLQVNQALCDIIGYTEEELLATTFQELSALNDLQPHAGPLQELAEGKRASYQMEMRYRHKDGSEVWALTTTAVVRSNDGKPLHYIGQIMDVTDRRRMERQLRHQAEHDMLTGLANRRVFAEALISQLARERRYGGESSLLMIDLDGFKEVNDGIGHAAGDLVLQAVADLIAARVRDTDLVARLGGDEFAVLLPETPRSGAEVLAIDIVQAVRELSVDAGAGQRAAVTASVGVACSEELPDDRDEDTLLAAADVAMYEAKRTGRDGYVVHGV